MPDAQRALRHGHPWLYDRSITGQSAEGRPGDLAVIFDDRRQFLAIGLYDPTSPLRVRILQHGRPASIDHAWLCDRLTAAGTLRGPLGESGTTGYRLVHGENDGLPGLVVNRYDATFVIKLYSAAWVPHLAGLRAALAQVCPVGRLALRVSRELSKQPAWLYGLEDGSILDGEPLDGPVPFCENGLHFEADVVRGQKTGFYFDQRDNRARVERLAGGRQVLNVFAYSGGFSVYAARGGAASVLSLDSSGPALAAAERNFALNQRLPGVAAAGHSVLVDDAFAALANLRARGRRFEMVIVDPPSFTRRSGDIGSAQDAYRRLVLLALAVLAPGGVLVMASCSSHVSAEAFFAAVNRAAAQTGRPLGAQEHTGHAIDHPVRFPEGAYLKCLFATVP